MNRFGCVCVRAWPDGVKDDKAAKLRNPSPFCTGAARREKPLTPLNGPGIRNVRPNQKNPHLCTGAAQKEKPLTPLIGRESGMCSKAAKLRNPSPLHRGSPNGETPHF